MFHRILSAALILVILSVCFGQDTTSAPVLQIQNRKTFKFPNPGPKKVFVQFANGDHVTLSVGEKFYASSEENMKVFAGADVDVYEALDNEVANTRAYIVAIRKKS